MKEVLKKSYLKKNIKNYPAYAPVNPRNRRDPERTTVGWIRIWAIRYRTHIPRCATTTLDRFIFWRLNFLLSVTDYHQIHSCNWNFRINFSIEIYYIICSVICYLIKPSVRWNFKWFFVFLNLKWTWGRLKSISYKNMNSYYHAVNNNIVSVYYFKYLTKCNFWSKSKFIQNFIKLNSAV